jgi:hypothetical protein
MLHANFFGLVPVGGVCAWLKTYGEKKTGINTSTQANRLIDSGANFSSAGVKDYMLVKNSATAGCGTMQSGTNRPTGWSFVDTSGVCTTTLTLKEDIFPVAGGTGKTYYVYATPYLPENFVECNGQTLSDSESIFTGLVIPDLNACSGTSRFLRGKTTSGGTGGSETHSHTVASHTHAVTVPSEAVCTGSGGGQNVGQDGAITSGSAAPSTDAICTLPSYYEVVWVLRIK